MYFGYAVSKAVSQSLAGAAWPVYESYEIEPREDANGDIFIYAPRGLHPGEKLRIYDGPPEDPGMRLYAPLRDYPDLFLRFAALSRKGPRTQDEMLETVLDWAERYSVLGLEGIDHFEVEGYSEHHTGRREGVHAFSREGLNAARVLELYEAATAEEPDARLTKVLKGWHFRTEGVSLKQQREFALSFVGDQVGSYVSSECYPVLYRTFDKESRSTLGFKQTFGFRSLLGAMYLQMMWLMIEGGSARRCARPGCVHIVEFEPPQLPEDWMTRKGARGKYRTRKDKKYCSDVCKQWVYDQAKKRRSSQARAATWVNSQQD